MDRRAAIEAILELMTEPARSLAREDLAGLPEGRGVRRSPDLVKAARAPKRLGLLLALEAAEWRLGGSIKTSTPKAWFQWVRIRAFPSGDVACAKLEADSQGRLSLQFVTLTDGLEVPGAIREAVAVVRDELQKMFGPVRLAEVA